MTTSAFALRTDPHPLEAARRPAEPNAPQAEAARRFEEMMVQQLFQILRSSLPKDSPLAGGGESGVGNYLSFFDQAFAESVTRAGGIGLGPTLALAFGEDATSSTHAVVHRASSAGGLNVRPSAFLPTDPAGPGGGGALQRAASELLAQGTAARFAKDAALLPGDLASDFATEAPGGVARFNVRDARGYQGYYKCNLFAFELARRAGYQVPVVARERGWGFPAPNAVTDDARDGRLKHDWGRIVTGASAHALDAALVSGEHGFILAGRALDEGRAGHMAVLERVHRVDYDPSGAVRRIEFDGWEARPQGAAHLVRRTWNEYGNPGGHDPRNGFDRIEIIELRRPSGPAAREVPLAPTGRASLLDDSNSRSPASRPKEGGEGSG